MPSFSLQLLCDTLDELEVQGKLLKIPPHFSICPNDILLEVVLCGMGPQRRLLECCEPTRHKRTITITKLYR